MTVNIELNDNNLIKMKEGFLHLPDPRRYIILDNLSDSKECMYAGKVQAENEYIPTFVFFANHKSVADYPPELKDKILEACTQKMPSYQNLIDLEKRLNKPLLYIIAIDEPELNEELNIANSEFIFR